MDIIPLNLRGRATIPSGDVHYKYYMGGYKLALPVSIVSSLFDWKYGIGYLVGYSLGRWIDPDWDLMSANAAEGRVVNELPLIGHLLYGISSSYGSFFREHHRSVWTHFPIFSTLIRLIWLFVVPFAVLDGYGINFIGNGWHFFWVGLWIGLSHADTIHYVLDIKGVKE